MCVGGFGWHPRDFRQAHTKTHEKCHHHHNNNAIVRFCSRRIKGSIVNVGRKRSNTIACKQIVHSKAMECIREEEESVRDAIRSGARASNREEPCPLIVFSDHEGQTSHQDPESLLSPTSSVTILYNPLSNDQLFAVTPSDGVERQTPGLLSGLNSPYSSDPELSKRRFSMDRLKDLHSLLPKAHLEQKLRQARRALETQDRPTLSPATTKRSHSLQGTEAIIYARLPLLKRLIPQPKEDVKVFWSRITLLSILLFVSFQTAIQAIVLNSEVSVYIQLQNRNSQSADESLDDDFYNRFLSGFTYHSAYLSALYFMTIIGWNGILSQNLIVIAGTLGITVAGVFLSLIQYNQAASTFGSFQNSAWSTIIDDRWKFTHQTYLGAGCILGGVWATVYACLSFHVGKEFLWRLYRMTGGDVKMERALFIYQSFVFVNACEAFLLILFSVLVLALANPDSKSVILIPTLGFLFVVSISICGFWSVRREKKLSVVCYLVGMSLEAGYTVWRATRIIDPRFAKDYQYIRMPALFFAGLSVFLVVSAMILAVVAARNFGGGLKEVLDQELDLHKYRAKSGDRRLLAIEPVKIIDLDE